MEEVLQRHLPPQAVQSCMELIKTHGVHLKITPLRKTRHGDYRRLADGRHLITVNASGNPYRFLITLIHEIAHLVAFERYGRGIKPHGKEWKYCFQKLMLPFIRPEVFPQKLLPVLARHFKNPRATSSTDAQLSLALKAFDPQESSQSVIQEIPLGSQFRAVNGKVFLKGNKRVKRYECKELQTGRMYLFQPHAEVELIA
jgi:hypothetical protein